MPLPPLIPGGFFLSLPLLRHTLPDGIHQFLVHVSYLIRDKQAVTGILCLGINLEIALKTLH